jgi:ATP-binding cassette subfamily B protein
MSGAAPELAWPAARLPELLAELGRRAGAAVREGSGAGGAPSAPLAREQRGEELSRWALSLGGWLGVELDEVPLLHQEVPAVLHRGGPAAIAVERGGSTVFLGLAGARRGRVLLLAPDLTLHKLPFAEARALLCEEVEAPRRPAVEAQLARLPLSEKARARVAQRLLAERLVHLPVGRAWLVSAPASDGLAARLWHAGVQREFAVVIGGHLANLLLTLGAVRMVAQGALQGHVDSALLVAWLLLLLAGAPFRALSNWAVERFSVRAGGVLKQQLLVGALRLSPDQVRTEGVGRLLGRNLESDHIEGVVLQASVQLLVVALELCLTVAVLLSSPIGLPVAGGLVLFLGGLALLSVRFARGQRLLLAAQLRLTHDLIERMVGYRTRLAQQPQEAWHTGEDELLSTYLERARAQDRGRARFALTARAWVIAGLLFLAPGYVAGATLTALAIALGGVLLGARALRRLSFVLGSALSVAASWEQIAPLLEAAARPVPPGVPSAVASSLEPQQAGSAPLLKATGLGFGYQGRARQVLAGVDLTVLRGDRLLLEGASGGGKSTLASLLSGLRSQTAGLLLLDGLDLPTLGPDEWRRRVGFSPQFHENHVVGASLAFNLLLGRRWPPEPQDLLDAEELCRALGLGPLLARMPGGLTQMVGETGWHLSHGEKSRLFLARALLQKPALVVLDESFAALDPQTLEVCLRCVLERAPAVLVIAHP